MLDEILAQVSYFDCLWTVDLVMHFFKNKEIKEEAASLLRCETELKEMDQQMGVDDDLKRCGAALFVCSTTGNGEFPKNAK